MQPKFVFEIYKNVDAGYVGRINMGLAHLVKLHGGREDLVKVTPPKEAY